MEKDSVEVGRIIGTTSLNKYMFAISKDKESKVRKDDFVSVVEPISKQEVIGIIRSIIISNQLLPDEFARESTHLDSYMNMYDFEEGEYLVGVVSILGHFERGEMDMPKYALRPGSKVMLTHDDKLRELMKVPDSKALDVGTIDVREDVKAYVDVNRLVSMHSAILAMTGAGKSYAAGVVIEEILKKNGAIIVIDPHGEYKYLGYKSDDTESEIHDNVVVFGIGKDAHNRIMLRANNLNTEDIASLIPGVTETQKGVLYSIIDLCRETNPEYTLTDLTDTLHMVLEKKENKDNDDELLGAKLDGKLTKLAKKAPVGTVNALIRRLDSLKRTGIVCNTETVLEELVKPQQVSVVDLSGVSENIRELVVGALARRIFYSRMNYVNGYGGECLEIPCLMCVEEAHNFIPRDFDRPVVSRSIMRKIAREGRKFGVGLCLISQRPSRLDQDVLSQCNTLMTLKIVNPIDQNYIRDSAESMTEDVINDLPSLNRGECIITGAAINFPMHVRIRERDTKPGGSDVDVVEAWKRYLGK